MNGENRQENPPELVGIGDIDDVVSRSVALLEVRRVGGYGKGRGDNGEEGHRAEHHLVVKRS